MRGLQRGGADRRDARPRDRLGASALATGHYARVVDDGAGPLLAVPADAAKDQTYMLSALRPESLAALRFPLASLTKPQVRELAAAAGLPVATKRESQDLCFLAGEGKRSFLSRHARLRERPGEIVDGAGRVVGRHRGHHNFTVGQRRGLGVAAGRAALRADDRRGRQPRRGGAARRAGHPAGSGPRAVLLRDGERVDRVKLRYRARPIGCRSRAPPVATRSLRGAVGAGLRRRTWPDRLPDGRRAGRRARHDRRLDCGCRELQRAPRNLPVIFRGARATAHGSASLIPAPDDIDPADDRGDAALQALLSR